MKLLSGAMIIVNGCLAAALAMEGAWVFAITEIAMAAGWALIFVTWGRP